MKNSLQKRHYRKILILHTAFLGDVILTLPLLQETRRLFPNAQIDFLTIPPSKNIVENNPLINDVIIYDKHDRKQRLRKLWHLSRRLKDRCFDLALVPHRSLRSALLVWLAGIPQRIGFSSSAANYLFTDQIERKQQLHEVERNLSLLKPFGYSADQRIYPQLHFSEADHQVVDELLTRHGIGEKEMIALAAGSVWATKRWLPERFAELTRLLAEKRFIPVLIGGPGDTETAEAIKEDAPPNLLDTTGLLTLRQSALLISKCRLLITNDSAPLHLGVSVSCPVVSIFGATVPAFGFYPYGPSDIIIETEANLSCRPCGSHGHHVCPIGTLECMTSITAQQVFSAVMEILKKR